MASEIITIASLKSGVGKTTLTYALASAACAGGLDVVAVDLDPSGGVTRGLAPSQRGNTIVDVFEERIAVEEALVRHPLGMRTIATHRTLAEETITPERLRRVLQPLQSQCDLLLLDTGWDEQGMTAAMRLAHRVVTATTLDILSMRAAALTAGVAQQCDALERVSGLVVGNVAQPLRYSSGQLLEALRQAGLAFQTVMWESPGWAALLGEGATALPGDLLLQSKELLREVAAREAPVQALEGFIALAQGRRQPATLIA